MSERRDSGPGLGRGAGDGRLETPNMPIASAYVKRLAAHLLSNTTPAIPMQYTAAGG